MDNSQVIFQAKVQPEPAKKALLEVKPKISSEEKFSPALRTLLERYRSESEKQTIKSNQPAIRVGEVLGSVVFLYERIRNIVDYKGEHLLRRNAIERILLRLLRERPSQSPLIFSHSLIRELIWARYLKNDTVSKSKIDQIAQVLSKYFRLLGEPGESQKRKWFLSMASVEIEVVLVPSLFYIDAYSQAMHAWFKKNFNWQNQAFSPEEKEIQVFIAVHRSLHKSDEARIRYHLFKLYYPQWERADEALISQVVKEISRVREEIEKYLQSPIQLRLYRFVRKHTIPFLILKQVIEENQRNIEKILVNPEKLEAKIKAVCHQRYAEIREKVNRGIIRSVIYIFMTKVLMALMIELPYEHFVLKRINLFPLSVNIFLSPVLMFLVGLTTKRPNEANTRRIVERIKGFVYCQQEEEKVSFSLDAAKRGRLTKQVFLFLYSFIFLLTFGGITYLLFKLNFNFVDAIVFFVFLSLVLLFGFRVRFTASEIMVTEEKEGFFSHLATNLSLPLLNLGVFLSKGLAKINFVVALMDFLIEAPLKSIIAVVEEWTAFIKEKREEVVEVPAQ